MLRTLFSHQESKERMHQIYETFYSRVYREAYFIVKDQHLAEDILQDTFLKAFHQLDHLEDPNKMGAWLVTITKHTAIDHLRKEMKETSTDLELLPVKYKQVDPTKNVEAMIEYRFIRKELFKKIIQLKKEHREILLLRYQEELKQKEISALKNIKIGTVKSRLHRARKSLKVELLKDKKIDPPITK